MLIRLLVTGLLAGFLLFTATARPVTSDWLQAQVDQTRQTHDLVALGASVARLGGDPITAVSGRTAKGSDTPVQPDHAWHIGSNTKALTALLYARLVEDGLADWGATLPELFPDLADEMDPAWASTTIEDLFAHRSGAGDIGTVWLIARRGDTASLPEQRYETTRKRLTQPPKGEPGTFAYSNLNYIIAGAAIEQLLELSWEQAMQDYVFAADARGWPEGWGFGPPQEGLQGHKGGLFGGLSPAGRGAAADNPKALGPAGTLHVPLDTHARLLLEFIDDDSAFITPGMREHLLTPWPDAESNYAMGWGVSDHEKLGRIYGHNGSNTMWLSSVELVPAEDTVIIVNANEYTDASRKAVRALLDRIEDRVSGED